MNIWVEISKNPDEDVIVINDANHKLAQTLDNTQFKNFDEGNVLKKCCWYERKTEERKHYLFL